MRSLVNYIRQVFCNHDWLIEEGKVNDDAMGHGTKIYMRCKWCGYHKKHWKFI